MKIIRLPEGGNEILSDNNDLAQLIQERLGWDAAESIRELIKESEREHVRAESDLLSYELSLEDNRETFNDLLDDCNTITIELQQSRLDKQRLGKAISNMKDKILRQL